MPQRPLDGAYAELLQSSRVSTPTREALDARARPDDPAYVPRVLRDGMLATLRALVDRIVPQAPQHAIDLAARIDRMLARGEGNGWRFSTLPPDAAAYRAGLRTLDTCAAARYGTPFVVLADALQDELLTAVFDCRESGSGDPIGNERHLDSSQMHAWFEEVRADAVRQYILMPTSLAKIGYSGIANGGDGRPKSGFVQVGLDEREDWEPLPLIGDLP